PSDTVAMQKDKILGFATNIGGRTSHTAIMARSLKIPAVVGLRDITQKVKPGSVIILDGNEGKIFVNPTFKQIERYKRSQKEFLSYQRKLETLRSLPPQTLDGREVELAVNIAGPEEIDVALRDGAEGVGLYRTEYLYMNRETLPSEAEQMQAYKIAAEGTSIIAPTSISSEKDVPSLFSSLFTSDRIVLAFSISSTPEIMGYIIFTLPKEPALKIALS
ncbi:unnamed protein product, partial [marine sediment metagenome]